MGVRRCIQLRSLVTMVTMCLPFPLSLAKTVYTDRYGDCFHGGPIEVEEEYTIVSRGGDAYDTLNCEMTFKTQTNNRMCLSFKEVEIKRCDLSLNVYASDSSKGAPLSSVNCHSRDDPDLPQTVCSSSNYLTVKMRKQELSRDGYWFKLELKIHSKSDYFAEGADVYVVGFSTVVGVIVGVIALVLIAAIVIVYCCCKHRELTISRKKSRTSCRTGLTDVPILEPSAPPIRDEPPAYHDIPPPYSASEGGSSPSAPVLPAPQGSNEYNMMPYPTSHIETECSAEINLKTDIH
ncbi:uncharacterized protein LOC127832689 isoform X2 [Dreissena polymorpha]|uniref:CUB domain-containing protein n=1 Tax=Dreissena polymorpha TaxID=45954 RepID=A0A9D4H289_DREPO|nr:uncharacterized protein LOC127832689 isoform X2 [Dreissena polymorpha]KAH3828076.1 hypothetical protein DPMN_130026 [Dreissena polymorpha]